MLTPAAGTDIPMLVGSFKRALRSRLPGMEDGRLWQRRYLDHVIRDADDFARHLDYLHFNPVKHGLVRRAEDLRWSSFGAWSARGVYEVDGSAESRGGKEDGCICRSCWGPYY